MFTQLLPNTVTAIMPNVAYLAIVAAEVVATLGALGQRALVAAGPAFFGTLLKKKKQIPSYD